MNGYDRYGGQGGTPNLPSTQSGMPQGITPPDSDYSNYLGGVPHKRSKGCAACLIGCLVVFGLAFIFLSASSWYGYTWFRDNVAQQKPLQIEPLQMTDEDVNEFRAGLRKLAQTGAEQIEVELTPEQARYLILASHWSSKDSPNGPFQYVDVDKLNAMDFKLHLDFPRNNTVEFAFSTPTPAPFSKGFLNIQGIMRFEITDAELIVDFEQIQLGDFKMKAGDNDIGGKFMKDQIRSNSEWNSLKGRVPTLKIENGKAKLKYVIK